MTERFLTTQETADLLRLHVATVRRMVRERRLPSVKLPGSQNHLIPRFELARLVDDYSSKPQV